MSRKVLVTDYAWKNLECERRVLEKAGATVIAAKTGDENELSVLVADVDGILTNWRRVSEKVIRNAPRCLVIGRYGIGLDNIDVQFATQAGIIVTNVPNYCVEEVSEHAMALLLSLARKVTFYDRLVKGGVYNLQAETPLYRISGKTLGILGFGNIARAFCRKAGGFGVKILVCSPRLKASQIAAYPVELVSFPELLRNSDYLSIHVPLTPETHHLFNLEAFRQMKPSAFILNTSRGAVIDERALLTALNDGLLAGAGIDVLATEPPDPSDPLIRHPRTIITPHAAFNSEESVKQLQETAATQLLDVLSGNLPSSVVNPGVLGQSNLRARFPGGKSSAE
jgi:D-3-phosphoglycerate dehydrogenase / 2-oxoglutarate reductase